MAKCRILNVIQLLSTLFVSLMLFVVGIVLNLNIRKKRKRNAGHDVVTTGQSEIMEQMGQSIPIPKLPWTSGLPWKGYWNSWGFFCW